MRRNVFDSVYYYHSYEFANKESVQDFKFFHEKLSSKVEISYHQHELYELYFHKSGNVSFYINGNNFSLAPGDIVAISPGELHRQVFEAENCYEMYIILVNSSFIAELSKKYPDITNFFDIVLKNSSMHIHPDASVADSVMSSILKLEKSLTSLKSKSQILKFDYFTELLFSINSIFDESENASSKSRSNTKINIILDYINNNLSNDLSLDMLSDMFYISKYHLLREFS